MDRKLVLILSALLSLWLILPSVARADALTDACLDQYGIGFVPAPFTVYNRNEESDPRDNTCGVPGNSIACPDLGEPFTSGQVFLAGCCQKIAAGLTEYKCVGLSQVTGPGGEQDNTRVDLKTEEYLAQIAAAQCQEPKDVKFVPQVTIPGSITFGEKLFTVKQGEGITITAQTASQYFALFYRFFIAALAVIAIVMVMWGGFKRIMAAGSPERIKGANETILGAISGLIIAVISYSLLNLINPALVSLRSLEAITPIQCVAFDLVDESEASDDIAPPSQELFPTVIYGDNIINTGAHKAAFTITLDLRGVAASLKDKGISLLVTSGLRSEAKQKELITLNRQNPPYSQTCNPKSGRPTTCILKAGPLSCPHTSGQAVDVWAAVGNTQVITQKDCLADRAACQQNSGMKSLADAMRAHGFCQLCSEPWHFEKPKMSACCR